MKYVCKECGSSDITANVWVPVGKPIMVDPIENAEYYYCWNCDTEVEIVDIDNNKE